jgi:hypothetical protein
MFYIRVTISPGIPGILPTSPEFFPKSSLILSHFPEFWKKFSLVSWNFGLTLVKIPGISKIHIVTLFYIIKFDIHKKYIVDFFYRIQKSQKRAKISSNSCTLRENLNQEKFLHYEKLQNAKITLHLFFTNFLNCKMSLLITEGHCGNFCF